jgi:hypothetical protein
VLDPAPARSDGATMFRLVAADHSGGGGGWLAFTGPSVVPLVPLEQFLPRGAPVAVAWQFSFLFPCQRQPLVRFGITEPSRYGVVWRNGAAGYGPLDNTWQVSRGGLFAPVFRTSGVTELGVAVSGQPQVRDVQVFEFLLPYQVDAYDLSVDRVTRWGWTGPPVAKNGG